MKRAIVWGIGFVTLFAGSACTNDPTPSGTSSADGGPGGSTAGAASTEAGALDGVDCTHPGAGKPLGAGRCACTTTRNVSGDWSVIRTCREGDLCTTRDKAEEIVLTQDGTNVRVERGDRYAITGVLCGDVAVWSGGPSDGLNPECGQLRFTDDAHYQSDSCYVASGECTRTFGVGCPNLKGQCTGTGAKKPEPATPIRKVLCNGS